MKRRMRRFFLGFCIARGGAGSIRFTEYERVDQEYDFTAS